MPLAMPDVNAHECLWGIVNVIDHNPNQESKLLVTSLYEMGLKRCCDVGKPQLDSIAIRSSGSLINLFDVARLQHRLPLRPLHNSCLQSLPLHLRLVLDHQLEQPFLLVFGPLQIRGGHLGMFLEFSRHQPHFPLRNPACESCSNFIEGLVILRRVAVGSQFAGDDFDI